jgi:hypothetical protein
MGPLSWSCLHCDCAHISMCLHIVLKCVCYPPTVSALWPDILVPSFMKIISQLFLQNNIYLLLDKYWCNQLMVPPVSDFRGRNNDDLNCFSVYTRKICRHNAHLTTSRRWAGWSDHNVSSDCLHRSKNVGTIRMWTKSGQRRQVRTRYKTGLLRDTKRPYDLP